MLERAAAVAAWLALPVSALLFAQWPLRDAIGAGSLQANDLAQWLFALYVAVAVPHAQRRGGHLVARPDLAAGASRTRRMLQALCVLPWSLFVLADAAPAVWRSVVAAERFPETLNPGYFMIKLALLLLALLMTLEAGVALRAAVRAR